MTAKKETTEKKEMTSEELQQLLEQDKNARIQACKREIDIVLGKYRCQLIAVPQFTPDGRTIAAMTLQDLPS